MGMSLIQPEFFQPFVVDAEVVGRFRGPPMIETGLIQSRTL